MENPENRVRICRKVPVKITIEGASEEFAEKVIGLAAQEGAELNVSAVDTGWTVDRAERYLRSLPAGARRFAAMVVADGDGYLEAEQLRQALGRLNGPTVALSRAMPRGVREGWWPEGTRAPISPVWDPDNPSWHKNIAYQMAKKDVPVFQEALARMLTTQKASAGEAGPTGAWEGDAPSAFAPAPGWGATDDVPRALLSDDEEQ